MRNNWFVNFLPEIVLNIKNSNWNYQFDHFSTIDQSRAKNFRQRENEKFYPQHGYFFASCLDDSRTIACPAAFYASAKLTPRSSILETRLYPPPRNVPLARLQFHARHFWPPTLTLSPIPFPISFFHFCFPHPLRRHNSATIVRIQSNFQLETRIFADRRPKVYRSHWSRCFLLIESSYVTCARVHGLIKPRVHSACIWQTFQLGLDFWRPEQVENRRLFVRERSCFRSMTRRWF